MTVKLRLYIGIRCVFLSDPRQPFSYPGLIGLPARNPRDMEQALVRVACLVRSKIQARFFRLSQAQLSRRSTTCHREGQLQLKRCGRMQLAPQSQKGFRHPVAEPARAVQPDVATNAKRDQQGLRVTLVAMMNDLAVGPLRIPGI